MRCPTPPPTSSTVPRPVVINSGDVSHLDMPPRHMELSIQHRILTGVIYDNKVSPSETHYKHTVTYSRRAVHFSYPPSTTHLLKLSKFEAWVSSSPTFKQQAIHSVERNPINTVISYKHVRWRKLPFVVTEDTIFVVDFKHSFCICS